MQGIQLDLVGVGNRGITSPGKRIRGKVMDCSRRYGYNATVVRSFDGKFRKWNPIVQVAEIKI